MGALFRLLLAGRIAAAARQRASVYAAAAIATIALSLVAATGFAFLIAAAYQALELRYSGPVASLSIGLGLLLAAAIAAAITVRVLRVKAARSRRSSLMADPSVDGLARVVRDTVGDVPPTVAVAAIAGFLYGMFKR